MNEQEVLNEKYSRWHNSFKLMQDREPGISDILDFVKENVKPHKIYDSETLEQYGPDVWIDSFPNSEILDYVVENIPEDEILSSEIMTKDRIVAYLEKWLQ